MEILIVLLLVGAVFLFVKSRTSSRERQAEAESLAAVRSVAEEDVTRLGEDVALLDAKTAGRELDEATRQDYRRALDSYDAAKAALDRMRRPEDVKAITGILEDGRYAMACVEARLEGRALPTRRPPCFFNPQHGPSTDDVEWAPPGGQPRPVPVCAADAERVRAGADPDVRQVPVGAGRRPYWQGGPGYGPYAQGYFSPYAGSGLLPGVLLGAVMFGGFGGWDGDGSDGGSDGGGDAGDGVDGGGDYGDGGGGDGGGGDFAGGGWGGGGGDWGGGGDFGGGDFGGF
jgi:hypothetical protein